jgi:hypothetical protein
LGPELGLIDFDASDLELEKELQHLNVESDLEPMLILNSGGKVDTDILGLVLVVRE